MKNLLCKLLFFNSLFFFLPTLAAQTLTESNLPIVIINTNGQTILDEPKITADLRIIWRGAGQINRTSDTNFHYNGKMGIEMRGSTSQGISDKKPYAVELRDAVGADLDIALLGMPAESDWAFIAPYSDKSLIRDALTYQLAASFMSYAPRVRFVEVILNNSYRGIYTITEKIKRDNNRINLRKLEPTTTSGDSLTGGYIIKIDKTTGAPPVGYSLGFNSNFTNNGTQNRTFYQYDYPKPEDINTAQKSYIQNFIRGFETIMNSSNFADATNGYASIIDEQSFIDFIIINELTRNVDGYRLSTYLHKNRNSVNPKLRAGSVWDFNIALGNANYCNGERVQGWAYHFNTVCPQDGFQVPFWWQKLAEEPRFRGKLATRWRELREQKLSFTTINNMIDSMANLLQTAQQRNFQKWQILGRYVWPNSYIGRTYSDEINYLKTWLTDRIRWIDGEMMQVVSTEMQPLHTLKVFPNPSVTGFQFSFFCKETADIKLLIFNQLGQIVDTQTRQNIEGLQQISWQADINKGIYVYQLLKNGQIWHHGKLVKQ